MSSKRGAVMSERIMASEKISEYKEPIRTIIEKDVEFVLTATKFVAKKLTGCRSDYKDNVGYLIDTNGNITRDISKAFIFKLSCVVVKDAYSGGTNEWDLIDKHDARIQFYKNGLYIDAMPLKDAQKWLYDHPLPRKNISKLTKGNVYAKYNGHCAYCGCELSLSEMKVDHHIAYKGQGGEDSLDNYYPACEVCNRIKSNLSIEDFKKAIRHCGEIHRKRKVSIMADSDKIAIKYGLTNKDKEITFYYETYKPKLNIDTSKEMML